VGGHFDRVDDLIFATSAKSNNRIQLPRTCPEIRSMELVDKLLPPAASELLRQVQEEAAELRLLISMNVLANAMPPVVA
jgi:hypothetical protein